MLRGYGSSFDPEVFDPKGRPYTWLNGSATLMERPLWIDPLILTKN